jgi:bud emergence protein 1
MPSLSFTPERHDFAPVASVSATSLASPGEEYESDGWDILDDLINSGHIRTSYSNDNHSTPSLSPTPSSPSPLHSNATFNSNNPPTSAEEAEIPFVMIKVLDRRTDDLIALRVHFLISHRELMEQVQARLGREVKQCLLYRNGRFIYLDNDNALRAWMEDTDKHMPLYAV